MTTELSGPRLRSRLRQADKIAENGKRAAAAQLYKEIIEEAPDTEAAWIGLANVETDQSEKEKALQKALAINPNSVDAKKGLAKLWGEVTETVEVEKEPVAAVDVVRTAVSSPPTQPDHQHDVITPIKEEDTFDLVCYRHPDRETGLRCYNCNKPICSQCAVKTPVGYSCPDCIREKEDLFFNSKPTDYIVAPLVAFPLSLIAGYLLTLFGGGFFMFFIVFFVGGLIGGFIGRMAKRAVGNRRGRYLPHTVGAMVILGVAIPSLPILLAIVFGNPGAILALLLPGIYAFVATGAAFYQMK
jgi:hypothetical protein